MFEDHRHLHREQTDEYETNSDEEKSDFKQNIQSLLTELVLHDPAALFVHLCVDLDM